MELSLGAPPPRIAFIMEELACTLTFCWATSWNNTVTRNSSQLICIIYRPYQVLEQKLVDLWWKGLLENGEERVRLATDCHSEG